MIDGVLSFSPEEELRLITAMAYRSVRDGPERWRVRSATFPQSRRAATGHVMAVLEQAVFECLFELS